jgi:hypothetical protein
MMFSEALDIHFSDFRPRNSFSRTGGRIRKVPMRE